MQGNYYCKASRLLGDGVDLIMGSTRSPEGYGIFYFLSFEVAPQVFSLKTISCILTFYIFRLYLREDFFFQYT